MRKLMMACMFGLLPLMGVATASSASAAAPGNMTLIDRLATQNSIVDEARYHRRGYRRGYRCYRVCTRRNYRGRCVRTAERCYRPSRRYYRW